MNFGGFTWEIDEFHGENAGLIKNVELELPAVDTPYSRPDWLERKWSATCVITTACCPRTHIAAGSPAVSQEQEPAVVFLTVAAPVVLMWIRVPDCQQDQTGILSVGRFPFPRQLGEAQDAVATGLDHLQTGRQCLLVLDISVSAAVITIQPCSQAPVQLAPSDEAHSRTG